MSRENLPGKQSCGVALVLFENRFQVEMSKQLKNKMKVSQYKSHRVEERIIDVKPVPQHI